MSVYTKDSRLSEPIMRDPSIIPVINRFGISLGVGDLAIKNICMEKGIDADFFLAVVNTYMYQDYFPEGTALRTHLVRLIKFLDKTDRYYRDVQLPNIERHFNFLLRESMESESDGHSNLKLLNGFFCEVKEELQASISNDLEHWFPLLLNNPEKAREEIAVLTAHGNNVQENIRLPFSNHNLEDKIRDLIAFFVIHLKGNYDKNLCVAVIMAVFNLEKDIKQNNRIRERILKPLCLK